LTHHSHLVLNALLCCSDDCAEQGIMPHKHHTQSVAVPEYSAKRCVHISAPSAHPGNRSNTTLHKLSASRLLHSCVANICINRCC
jgi:hypothetical protein